MAHRPNQAWLALGSALGAVGLAALLAAGGCVAIADIGDIEIGTTAAGGGGVGGTGAGGTGAGGTGAGGTAGSGGAAPTCSDGQQNGEETGVDCGGPSCPACSEDCTNGVDDDGNNLIDCADSLCSGYHCAPEAPQGWTGPEALYLGDQDPLPSCDVAWPSSVSGGSGTLNAPDAQCTACGCDPPAGAFCEPPDMSVWTSPFCPGPADTSFTIPAINGCHDFGGNSNDSVIVGVIPVSGGTCDATGGQATVEPATWSAPAMLCQDAAVGAGCGGGGQVCVRQPESPFRTTVCISQDGDVDCPADHYTEKHLVVLDVIDARECTDCTCGAPTGLTCTGTTMTYTNQACSMDEVAVPNDGMTCVEAPGAKSVRVTVPGGPAGGSCASDGGVATGDVVVDTSTTVCCLPE